MFDAIQDVSAAGAALLAGIGVGAAWIAAVISPNCSFDRLDHSRADAHVRELLERASRAIALILLAAAALAMLGGSVGGAILTALAAAGFFSNQWTLAPSKLKTVAPGVRKRTSRKSKRVVAVSLSLLFAVVALVGGALAVFGV